MALVLVLALLGCSSSSADSHTDQGSPSARQDNTSDDMSDRPPPSSVAKESGDEAITTDGAHGGPGDSAPATPGAPPPPSSAGAFEMHWFDDLDTMVATSDTVLVGSVTATQPGRLVGDSPGFRLQERVVEVAIDEALHGRVDAEAIMILEIGWAEVGPDRPEERVPLEINDVAASAVGDEGIYFLRAFSGPGAPSAYEVINSQGRYLAAEGDRLQPSSSEGGLSASLAARGYEQLRTDVLDAAERVRSGDVHPQELPVERSND